MRPELAGRAHNAVKIGPQRRARELYCPEAGAAARHARGAIEIESGKVEQVKLPVSIVARTPRRVTSSLLRASIYLYSSLSLSLNPGRIYVDQKKCTARFGNEKRYPFSAPRLLCPCRRRQASATSVPSGHRGIGNVRRCCVFNKAARQVETLRLAAVRLAKMNSARGLSAAPRVSLPRGSPRSYSFGC